MNTATERGDRAEAQRMGEVRPVVELVAERMVWLAGRMARDGASGLSPQISMRESGLPRPLAEWVRDGCKLL